MLTFMTRLFGLSDTPVNDDVVPLDRVLRLRRDPLLDGIDPIEIRHRWTLDTSNLPTKPRLPLRRR